MRSIIGVCTSPPEAESFSFGCTSFDEREKRREREKEREGRRRLSVRGDHLRIVEYARSTNIQRYYVPPALFRL